VSTHALLIVADDADDLERRVATLKLAAADLDLRVAASLNVSAPDDRAAARAVLDHLDIGEDVEARARARYERLGFGPHWDRLRPEQREPFRVMARRG
jgi:hypothetical protein